MMTGRHKCLLLLESEFKDKRSWNGDILKLRPESAIEKFLTKWQILEKFCNVAVLHLCSALLAYFQGVRPEEEIKISYNQNRLEWTFLFLTHRFG